jgi:hypothetical protein
MRKPQNLFLFLCMNRVVRPVGVVILSMRVIAEPELVWRRWSRSGFGLAEEHLEPGQMAARNMKVLPMTARLLVS